MKDQVRLRKGSIEVLSSYNDEANEAIRMMWEEVKELRVKGTVNNNVNTNVNKVLTVGAQPVANATSSGFQRANGAPSPAIAAMGAVSIGGVPVEEYWKRLGKEVEAAINRVQGTY